MPEVGSISDHQKRLDARLATTKRVNTVVAATYFYEILLLGGFCAAGYISVQITIPYTAAVVLANIVMRLILESGWNRRLSDPTLHLPQQLCAIIFPLVLALAAPQLAILSIGNWIAVTFFGFLAPNRRDFFICLGATLAASAIAFILVGSRLSLPVDTVAGRFLSWAELAGVLLRCVGVTRYFQSLRGRVKDKNRALHEALTRIEILAQRDELTDLPNRRAIMAWLAEQIAICQRLEQPLTIALIDLDHFKHINDEFGHPAGDLVLQKFAECGLMAIRATDRLGRFGGEEFLVGLVNTSLQAAEEPLQRLRCDVGAIDWNNVGPGLHVTVTVGAAAYRRGETIEQLIKRADVALYRGKAGGRNRVVFEDRPFAIRLDGMNGLPA